MTIVFRKAAEADLADAIGYYQAIDDALATRFQRELEIVIDRIVTFPASCQVVHRDVRRALLKRFPHAVFYKAMGDQVVVVAILHPARDPARSKARS